MPNKFSKKLLALGFVVVDKPMALACRVRGIRFLPAEPAFSMPHEWASNYNAKKPVVHATDGTLVFEFKGVLPRESLKGFIDLSNQVTYEYNERRRKKESKKR